MSRSSTKSDRREGIALSSALSLEQLKLTLRQKHGPRNGSVVDAENLQSSRGVRTGWSALDSFIEGGGFPCGKISLLECREGLGASTLWLETAALLTQAKHRVAWLNSASDDREPYQLHATTALQRGVDLQKLYLVETPSQSKRLWILQELLASQLFSLVGCDLGEAHIPLRECRSLLMQARRSGAAVVLLSRGDPPAIRSLASLVLKFSSEKESPGIEVIRASHRPVPQTLQRRDRHVDFITGTESNSSRDAGTFEPSFSLSRNSPRIRASRGDSLDGSNSGFND